VQLAASAFKEATSGLNTCVTGVQAVVLRVSVSSVSFCLLYLSLELSCLVSILWYVPQPVCLSYFYASWSTSGSVPGAKIQ
jgi:hypothetical protein